MKLMHDTLIGRRNTIVAADTVDEAILLDIDSGYFFQLNKTAALIWNLAEQPITFAALCDAMRAKFNVNAQECEADVQAFVADLAERGLLEFQ